MPAFRAFGAPGRGTPLPYPPAYARIAGLGPIPRPPCAGPLVRPAPSADRRAARLPLFEGGKRSDPGFRSTPRSPASRPRLRKRPPPERRATRQIEFARQFPKPEVFRLSPVPGTQGTPGSAPEPYPPGHVEHTQEARCVALEWARRRGSRVSNSLRVELPTPPSRERHARRATAGQHRRSRRPRRSGHAHLQPHRRQRCARHNVFAILLRRLGADPRP